MTLGQLAQWAAYIRKMPYFYEIMMGGRRCIIVHAGFPFNHGKVYRVYDEKVDCVFYDLDCGWGVKESNPEARLACMRLEDEKIFYIQNG